MSKVYLLRTDKESIDLESDIEKLFDIFSDYLPFQKKTAIKLHFGERESDTHLDSKLVEAVYEKIDEESAETSLMDCNVLYNSDRALGSTHLEVAKDNGFDFAPIDIGDGEKGEDEMIVPIGLNHFEEARLGKSLEDYDFLFVLSHLTGHNPAGFGGSFKNIGMGLGSKSGKLEMHQAFNLEIESEDCIACGRCVQECPVDAISIKSGSAGIDQDECIGCGACIAVCPEDAIVIPWEDSSAEDLQERIVEYAYAVLQEMDTYFMNVLMDITPECDCIDEKQTPVMDDVGILISDDIVSIDQASLDLTEYEKFDADTDPYIQPRYGESLGMGERDYDLIEL